MIQALKNVLRSSTIYSIGNLGNKLIGFILLPLYTDHLTTADYGTLGLLESTAVILVAVLSLRVPTAMIRWCSDTTDEQVQKRIVFTSFASLFFIVFLFNLLLQPFNDFFSQLLFQKTDYSLYFRVLFISIGLEILGKIPLEYLRFQERPLPFILINSLRLGMVLGLNIYLVAYAEQGVMGVILSQAIGHALIILLCLPYLLSNFSFQFDLKVLREMMRYGYPLIYSTLASMLLSYTDRYLIPYFHDESALGVYTLGYKIASISQVFLIQSFQLGFLPIAFKMLHTDNFKPFFIKVVSYFVVILVIFNLGLAFFSKEVIELFARDQSYWAATALVPLFGFIFLFKGLEYVFTLGLHFEKQTKYNIRIVLVGLMLNVGLNLWLIPRYNILGAVIASVISSFGTAIYSYYISQKIFPVSFELKKIYKLFIITIIYVGILYGLNQYPLSVRLISKIILLSMLPVLLWFWRFFDQKEIKQLKSMVQKWKRS